MSAAPVGQTPAEKTFAFVSLGCPKNLVDSERMLGLLAQDGYAPVNDPRGADMVVVNTCAFIESSRAESRGVIREMTDLKAAGQVGAVVVTGCLAERSGPQLITDIPMIDSAVGVFARDDIVQVADRATARTAERFMNGAVEQRTLFRPAPVRALGDAGRLRVTPKHYAYLKISEGCDRRCAFCAIPKMRGRHATKPMDQVVAEAEELVADGVRELVLVSQDATYYGMDVHKRPMLAELLRRLDAIDGLEWIRLLYAYPEFVTDDLVETLAGAERIVPYLDMPLQHASDPMLRRMRRRHTRAKTADILHRLRSRWQSLSLRTTFIVGFPGETDAEFAELVEFVREQRFARMGVFTYSIEEGTPGAAMPDQLPEDVKNARRDELMRVQQEITFAAQEAKIGSELTVVVDAADPDEDDSWIARTTADAPEIDTLCYVQSADLKPGQFTRVKVNGTYDYDLTAEPVGQPW